MVLSSTGSLCSMRRSFIWTSVSVALFAGPPAFAQPQQFTMVDVVYEHSATTTRDSHYRVRRPATAPTNWKAPIDYTMGTVYTYIEVMTKPSDAATLWNICFEGSPSYACYGSRSYRTPTVLHFASRFPTFYQYTQVDWSRPIANTALILKDTNNVKPAPENVGAATSALYMPTRVRIVVTIVAPGAVYMPPANLAGDGGISGVPRDAGARDAPADSRLDAPAARPDGGEAGGGGAGAGAGGASGQGGAGGTGGSPPGTGGSPASGGAMTGAGGAGGGRPPAPPPPAVDDQADPGVETKKASGGCSVARGDGDRGERSWPAALLPLALLAGRRTVLAARARRRR
jgi:hypothetical protein